jgi:hypothetical protein
LGEEASLCEIRKRDASDHPLAHHRNAVATRGIAMRSCSAVVGAATRATNAPHRRAALARCMGAAHGCAAPTRAALPHTAAPP